MHLVMEEMISIIFMKLYIKVYDEVHKERNEEYLYNTQIHFGVK